MSTPDHIVSETITIQAPAHVVFDIVADPRQHARIDGSGSVKAVTIGPDRLSQDARFGARMKLFGVPYRITNRVVEFDADRRIAWRHFGGHRWRYELESVGASQTRVTESFDYSHYNGRAAGALERVKFPERNRRGILATLVKLKAAAEQDASA